MSEERRDRIARAILAIPWPNQPCLHPGCGGLIKDVWTELMETPEEKSSVATGKADFTCPYCSQALHYDPKRGISLPQGGDVVRYHYGSAVNRAAIENTSIFGLMRSKEMVLAGRPAFLGYTFKDRSTPLTEEEGEEIHKDPNP